MDVQLEFDYSFREDKRIAIRFVIFARSLLRLCKAFVIGRCRAH